MPEQPGPGGEPGHAQHAEVVARRDAGQVGQHADVRGVQDGDVPPARVGEHQRALGDVGERDSTTRPTAPPCMVSPISQGAA